MKSFIWSSIWHLLKKREYPGVHQIIQELKRENNLSLSGWENRRCERLNSILTFAARNVPYYKKLMIESGIDLKSEKDISILAKLPLLTKNLIQNNIKSLIADNFSREDLFENATGGSTGVPLKFYQSLQYQAIGMALDVVVRDWWGIKPYDKTAQLWGADREFFEFTLKEKIYHALQRVKDLNAFRMTEDSLLEFCQMLERWSPPYLMGYSSALEALARLAQKNNKFSFSLKAIRSTAENLYPHQRNLIENLLKAPVYNFYGTREINNLAAECPE